MLAKKMAVISNPNPIFPLPDATFTREGVAYGEGNLLSVTNLLMDNQATGTDTLWLGTRLYDTYGVCSGIIRNVTISKIYRTPTETTARANDYTAAGGYKVDKHVTATYKLQDGLSGKARTKI